MLPFSKQVGIASDIARLGVARLAGIDMPPWTGADDPKNRSCLQAQARGFSTGAGLP